MTWLVLTDITQKIHSVSKICSALDPKQRILFLNPMSTTDFKMLDKTLILFQKNLPLTQKMLFSSPMMGKMPYQQWWIGLEV